MKNTSLRLLFGAALLLPALEDFASARSVSAFTGHARDGSESECFTLEHYLFSASSMKSECDADFIVPLTVDNAGTKTLQFTSRATSAGAQCRVVANNPSGSAYSASSFKNVPVGADFGSQTTASVVVPGMGVFFADCIANSGAEFYEFDYTP